MKFFYISLLVFSTVLRAEVSVKDYRGTEIHLMQPAQRVIGMSPHVVENIYSAGAAQRLIAVMSYSNFPEAALQLPVVGDYNRTNYELITELKPDLIVVWNSGRYLDVVKKLRSLGFQVYVDEPHKLEDVARSIRDMGKLMGTEEISVAAAEQYMQRLVKMRKQYSQRSVMSVLYQVQMNPLQTLNGDHIISDVIDLCGGQNIFANEKALSPKINIEAVIANNPEVIIGGGLAAEQSEWLAAWKHWPVIEAVKQQQVYAITPDIISRHTVRLLDGAHLMCEYLDKARLNR